MTTWTGQRPQHCTACHHTFNGTTAGDMHRVGRFDGTEGPDGRRCLTPVEMLAKGMGVNRAGYWTTGRDPGERLRPATAGSATSPNRAQQVPDQTPHPHKSQPLNRVALQGATVTTRPGKIDVPESPTPADTRTARALTDILDAWWRRLSLGQRLTVYGWTRRQARR